MPDEKPRKRIGLPGWILIAAVSGIGAGLFFGERCTVLEPIASAYVMLLESVVYPYIMCTLLHGLGQLTPDRGLRLFRSGWHFMLLLWGITFSVMILLTLAIPSSPGSAVIDPMNQTKISKGLLQLLIPANLSTDLVRNYVPAVVVFCILFGIALQHFPKREGLLDILEVIRGASVKIWRWLVHLAPFAVFAMFAQTAGTTDVDHLLSLLLYLALYLGGTALLTFVILPMVMSALMPVSYREILSSLKSALVLAAVTTLSAVALPFILEAAQKLAAKFDLEKDESDEIIQTTLSISYPLAQLGNYFVYIFLLFASFYYRAPLNLTERISLPFMTLLSCIGCPTSSVNAVGFLGSWLSFPQELSEFYIETMIVTRYGQVLCSVMGFAFATFLITLSYFGKLKFNLKRLLQATLLALVLIVVLCTAMLSLGKRRQSQPSYLDSTLANSLTADLPVTFQDSNKTKQKSQDSSELSALAHVQQTQTLRVGYNPHIIPFCYYNRHGDLVGYDIAYAYALARALNAKLEFVPFEWKNLKEDLIHHRFDIAMSGVYITEDRLRKLDASNPYHQSPLALIVHTDQTDEFLNMDSIQQNPDLRLSVFNDPLLESMAHQLFPKARITKCENYDELVKTDEFDAALWTLDQARVWAQEHPGYTAVRPVGLAGVKIFGYLLPPNSSEFVRFLNHWLELKQADGFQQQQIDYWLRGKSRLKHKRRWNILDTLKKD